MYNRIISLATKQVQIHKENIPKYRKKKVRKAMIKIKINPKEGKK